jgi:hypothetical protein
MPSELAPLQAALDSILNRLACLETKVGLEPTATVSSASSPSPIVEGKHASIIPTVYICVYIYNALYLINLNEFLIFSHILLL